MKTIKFKELVSILKKRGWSQIRTSGSHLIFTKKGNNKIITVPFRRGDVNIVLCQKILKQTKE